MIDTSQSKLSEELEIAQQEISKSLKKLVDKGFIEIFAQRGRQNVYKLNQMLVRVFENLFKHKITGFSTVLLRYKTDFHMHTYTIFFWGKDSDDMIM